MFFVRLEVARSRERRGPFGKLEGAKNEGGWVGCLSNSDWAVGRSWKVVSRKLYYVF